MNAWRTFLAWLATLAADPAAIDTEPPRTAAAVAAAYATFAPDALPPPAPPSPVACACGGKCVNGEFRPDGRIVQKCAPGCASCKPKSAAPCPTGAGPPGATSAAPKRAQ